MSDQPKSSGLLSQTGLGLALGIALVVCTALATKTYISVKESQNYIQVKGYAEKAILSESGIWTGTINAANANAINAYKSLDEQKNSTLDLLKSEGYDPATIQWGTVHRIAIYKKSPDGQYTTNEIEKYELSQNVDVTSNEVQKLATLPAKINDLNLKGHDVSAGSVRFYYPSDKLDALKVSLLADASKSARERADQFAINSGNKIGRLLNARQGVFQVTAPNSSDISDYGTYDTSSINKVVKIVVTMTYSVKE